MRGSHDLSILTAAELDVLFAQGATAGWEGLQGDYRGRFLAWNPALRWHWSMPLRLMRALLFDWRGWWGKRFCPSAMEHGYWGINLFGADRTTVRYAFQVYNTSDAITLDYGCFNSLMSWIRDDVRFITPGLLLGQMWLCVPGRKPVFVGYFELRKEA